MSAQATLAFLRAWLASPTEVGAILPSSRALASAMSSAASDLDRGGPVIEAGPGSGSITRSLLDVFGAGRLRVVERSADLAAVLRQRYPTLQVVQGNIEHQLELAAHDAHRTLLVSSIPFKSLPPPNGATLQRHYLDFARAGGEVLQFSYGWAPPFPIAEGEGLRWQRLRRIWWNVPPARLWRLADNSHFRDHT